MGDSEDKRSPLQIGRIRLVECDSTTIIFEEKAFMITYGDGRIFIARDADNFAIISLVDQHFDYAADVGGFATSEKVKGQIDYSRHLTIDWEDDMSVPEVSFKTAPVEVTRNYSKGQFIELGTECVNTYHIIYRDGVEAWFSQEAGGSFKFRFSTGFAGSFQEMPDGSYNMTFKGDRLEPGEDELRSQSKFILTRSKYTGKLMLILQEGAMVHLS